MPKSKSPRAGRPVTNYDPKRSTTARAARSARSAPTVAGSSERPGSRSPLHRGFRAEEPAERKARWSREERTATGRSPHRADSESATGSTRIGYPRPESGYSRPESGRASVRGAGSAVGGDYRGSRFDRSGSSVHSNQVDGKYSRDERSSYVRNTDRNRGERAGYPDRTAGSTTAGSGRNYRSERSNYSERSAERVARGGERFERGQRGDGGYPDRFTSRPNFARPNGARGSSDRSFAERRPSGDRQYGERSYTDQSVRPGFGDRDRYHRAGDRLESKRGYHPGEDVVLERLEAQAINAQDIDGISFADLGLGSNIVRVLAELGANAPFPIQAATIPVVLSGQDVLGRGKTGSGKTIAFGAPTVELLMRDWAGREVKNTVGIGSERSRKGRSGRDRRELGRKPRGLILAPTRELALQIDRTVQPIAQAVGLFTTQIYGGVPQARQVSALQRGVDIIIGTPGRIEDLVAQRRLDLSEIQITVVDEADHMCDLGFLEPVQRILRLTKLGGQRLLFSATLDKGVAKLVDEFLNNPAVHEVAGEDQASSTIDHQVYLIDPRQKRDIVAQLADREGKVIVFSRTRIFAEELSDHLEDYGILSVSLHGDLNQSRRTRNLQQLSSGRVQVLVATDVAARGIHIDDVDLVIQADAPDDYKSYLHRAGRTGRAGKVGQVVTLIPHNRRRKMADLLGRAEIKVDFVEHQLGDELPTR